MSDTKKLGAELGDHFARIRALGSVHDQEAKLLVDEIAARDPKIRLPQILANERVKEWQHATSVTDTHLRDALAKCRAELRDNPVEPHIKIPKRTRKRSLTIQDGRPQDGRSSSEGIVPNRSLDQL